MAATPRYVVVGLSVVEVAALVVVVVVAVVPTAGGALVWAVMRDRSLLRICACATDTMTIGAKYWTSADATE